MTGMYLEKETRKGQDVWILRDTSSKLILSFGNTAVEAVDNYETSVENEKMARELGVSLDDVNI